MRYSIEKTLMNHLKLSTKTIKVKKEKIPPWYNFLHGVASDDLADIKKRIEELADVLVRPIKK